MRLLVVSSWMPYPPDNGSRLRAYHLLKHLARRHTVTLLTFGRSQEADDLGPLQELCERVEVVAPVGVKAKGLGVEGLLSTVPRYYAQARSARMDALVDTVHGDHDAVLGLQIDVALSLLRAAGTRPTVLDEVEVGGLKERYALERNLVRRCRHGLTWWKFRRFVRVLVSRFDRATVVSARERDHLRAIGCDIERVAVVPNGVEVPEVSPAGPRAVRLIYPGSVTYSANLDAVRFFIRDVLPIIRRSRPDLGFTVTGSTRGVDIADLARTEGVIFTGQLPDANPMIAGSAACVVPLRIGGGTRLKVLHAMALATPVVSTSKGIEGLDVEPGRHVLVADSAEAFAAQVLRVLGDPELGARLASAGRDVAERRYAWGPIGDALNDVIDRAVADRRSRSRAHVG